MSARIPLFVILVATFLFGLLNVIFTGKLSIPTSWKLTEQLLLVMLIYWWYYLDKTQRTMRTGPLLNIGVVALPIVAIPVYLFRSRGFKSGFVSFLLFIGFCATALATLVVGAALGKQY